MFLFALSILAGFSSFFDSKFELYGGKCFWAAQVFFDLSYGLRAQQFPAGIFHEIAGVNIDGKWAGIGRQIHLKPVVYPTAKFENTFGRIERIDRIGANRFEGYCKAYAN